MGQIQYSEKYFDDTFEYRHVVLPPEVAKLLPKNRLLSEGNRGVVSKNVGKSNLSEFMKTYFGGDDEIKLLGVKSEITSVVKKIGMEDDFVRLMSLYLTTTVFFPNPTRINWSFVPHIEDLNGMRRISWPKVIHAELMDQIRRKSDKLSTVSGCVVALLVELRRTQRSHGEVSSDPLKEIDPENVLVELGTKSSKEEKLLDLNFKVEREVISNEEAMRIENENLKRLIDELRDNQKKDKEEIENLKKEIQILDEDNKRLKEEKQLEIVRHDDSVVQIDEENQISKRGLERKKNEEIGSLVKRAKKRTILETRKEKKPKDGDNKSPKKRRKAEKKEVDAIPITVDEWPTPIVDPMSLKMPGVTTSMAWPYLEKKEKKIVEQFFKNAKPDTIAWEDEWKELTLSALMVMDLMLGRFVDSQIINWYGRYLQRNVKGAEKETFFFDSCIWTYVRDNLTASVGTHLTSEIESLGDDVTLYFFPMIYGKYKNDKVGNHWTLLVYNTISDKWTHYDSMVPRNSKEGICFKDAEQLQIRVSRVINDKRRMECLKLINPKATIKSSVCTQQNLESADCALYVCLFMETLVAKEQMPHALGKEAMHRNRASKAYKIFFINYIFEKLAQESSRLARYNKKSTITSREIQTTVRLVLLGELAKHALFKKAPRRLPNLLVLEDVCLGFVSMFQCFYL
ncbi:hypothetical protein IFM89_033364 [Coptis chinensis]|uniref:Cyclin-dependent kinases regulatory subunit n=1 Tax=Coptis chinensis TaxID=261450 RepID=A0A835LPN5_9MAGN|nr:hypothetical protein IFM89_033364 [Coptis chinensis]